MKHQHLNVLCTFLLFCAFILSKNAIAQNITADTTLANEYYGTAEEFYGN
jgi:hypothetical protein